MKGFILLDFFKNILTINRNLIEFATDGKKKLTSLWFPRLQLIKIETISGLVFILRENIVAHEAAVIYKLFNWKH